MPRATPHDCTFLGATATLFRDGLTDGERTYLKGLVHCRIARRSSRPNYGRLSNYFYLSVLAGHDPFQFALAVMANARWRGVDLTVDADDDFKPDAARHPLLSDAALLDSDAALLLNWADSLPNAAFVFGDLPGIVCSSPGDHERALALCRALQLFLPQFVATTAPPGWVVLLDPNPLPAAKLPRAPRRRDIITPVSA